MKKSMLVSGAFVAVIGLAHAEDGVRPYVGVDYTRAMYSYDTDRSAGVSAKDIFKDSANGVTPYIGLRVNKYFSTEMSYLQTASAEEKNVLGTGINTKYKLHGFAIDAIGSLPVDQKETFSVLGSAGVGSYKADLSMSANGLGTLLKGNTDSDVGYKLGAGAQYQLTDHIGIRAMGRYIKVDVNNTLDHITTGDIGVNYRF